MYMGFLESFGIGFLILVAIALVVSSVGFYKYVYFISLYSAAKYKWLVG